METLTNEEYEQIRLKDYDYAKSLYDTIQECRDIGVRDRDSRLPEAEQPGPASGL